MTDLLPPINNPELLFALVAPIGVDLSAATACIQRRLHEFSYTVHEIRISSTFSQFHTDKKVDQTSTYKRYRSAMDVGNEIRKKYNLPGILAIAGVSKICQIRTESKIQDDAPYLRSTCYLINQLKRPEEIDILRRTYGNQLFVFAITSSLQTRVDNLAKKIKEDDSSQRSLAYYNPKALELINRDEEEEDNKFGQRLRDAFSRADFFIDGTNIESFEDGIERAIDLIFGKAFISPRRNEFFMNLANNFALQSADLSRQVGAVIIGDDNDIIAYGCNEVPRAGGDVYWDGDEEDFRDHTLEGDPNVDHKNRLIQDILNRINPILREKFQSMNPAELQHNLWEDKKIDLGEAQLNDLLEFGRVVHAEMNALSQAARTGKKTKHATLFCTTFPCHVCARHIIASGISRVIYIEPYAKSLAIEQYPESIKVEGREIKTKEYVEFQKFSGVSPIRFRQFFAHRRRKDDKGKALIWRDENPRPICESYFPSYLQNEIALIRYLSQALRSDVENEDSGANSAPIIT